MAEPFITFLIDKVCTLVGEKVFSGFFGLEEEFEKMKRSLPSLKSLFIDLQKSKNQDIRNSEVVKTNVVMLRELLYEADDILLDCQIYEESNHNFISKSNYRHETKRRLHNINGEISNVEKNLRTYCLPIMVQQSNWLEGSSSCATNGRWTTSLPNQVGTVGLAKDVQRIKDWILAENNELKRVGIVGMGGLGKTTLAQKIFNDKCKKLRNGFRKKIWVSVSQPVDVVQIMRTILDELGIRKHSSDSVPATLLQQIKVALTKTSYLIIMDDVWSLEDGWWSQILKGLTQDGEYNSCIIITTRNEEVARSMGVRDLRILRPKLLGDEDSWSLLCKVAFSSPIGTCRNPELEEMGKNIAKKCGGLPLAIKAIAGLLSTKSRSISEWQKINEDFRAKLEETTAASDGNSVIASLQLSYDDLPSHLKQCILCCSIYPEDFHIKTKQLVYWWAAEGFVVQGNNKKTTKQLAYDCLYELFSRCLIEPVEDRSMQLKDRLQECKMHDMVRELIIKVSKQEAFSSFDDGNEQIFDKDTRHFGLTVKSAISIQHTKASNSKIRALLGTRGCGGPYSKWKSDLILTKKVNTLRVLDLSNCDVSSPKKLIRRVKSQKRLVYLNLSYSEWNGEPTEFVKDLHNLQYLEINQDCVKSVSSLRKLRLLGIYRHRTFKNPESHKHIPYTNPEGLANLINLEELSGIKLGNPTNRGGGPGGNCSLGELINLPKLRVLQVYLHYESKFYDNSTPADADLFGCEMNVLTQLGNLQVLSIELFRCSNEQILKHLDQLIPPPSLQELRITQIGGETVPGFIKPELLPELRHLIIESSNNLTYLSPNFWGVDKRWNLETLSLIVLPELQLNWETVRQMMPCISCVEIKNVLKVESFPGKTFQMKFSVWRKIDEEDSITGEVAGPKKRKRIA